MRAFLALVLSPGMANRTLDAAVRGLGGIDAARRGFRLPRADGLHVTLHFFGELTRPRLETVCAELREASPRWPAPSLELRGSGAFPRRGQERVLWVGVDDRTGALAELAAAIRGIVARHGFEVDERAPFRPHVTVARPRRRPRIVGVEGSGQGAPRERDGAGVPGAFYRLELAEPWRPSFFAAVESVAAERGPRLYRIVEPFHFASE